jgi:hypothetical protein
MVFVFPIFSGPLALIFPKKTKKPVIIMIIGPSNTAIGKMRKYLYCSKIDSTSVTEINIL